MKNILIVEDAEAVAEALAALLRPLADRIVIASTMKEALSKLETNGFSLVLLDLTLPDSLRHETLSRIGEIKAGHDRRVVIISAAPATTDELLAAREAGADSYLEKHSPVFQELVCEMAGDL